MDNDFLENILNEVGVEGRYAQCQLTWNHIKKDDRDNNPTSDRLGSLTLAAAASASAGGSSGAPASGSSGGSAFSEGTSAPTAMPKTGMGGAETNSFGTAALLVVLLAVVAVVFIRTRRTN
jgi:uncharacterized membrane protein